MAKLNVKRSIQIDAPVEKVYGVVSDFHQWQPWSPWLIMEPGVKVTVQDDGKYYEWEGNRVGAGNMTVLSAQENEWVDYDLMFLKPWKSQSNVRFEVKSENGGTKVTWYMDSKLPFFLFWMKKMMNALLAMDYDRGLAMLKDYVEKGKVNSQLEFEGESQFEGLTYVGIKSDCAMSEIGPKMDADFKKITAFLEDHKDLISGAPISIYHKWDMVKGKAQYTSAIPVSSVPSGLPSDFIIGEVPPTKVYTLKHRGDYGHLGNAWSTMMSMVQNKTFKQNKKIHPFEVYQNDPAKVPAEELITEVKFAIK